MPIKNCKTEQHIIDTARRVFFTEGRINATTQEIADAAGVNRTLINYYFRSKQALFNIVLDDYQNEQGDKYDAILLSDLNFREKTEALIDFLLEKISLYPFLEYYYTQKLLEARINGVESRYFLKELKISSMHVYMKEADAEMAAGRLPDTGALIFVSNLYSLVMHPLIMKPLHMQVFEVSEKDYEIMLQERKKIILDILFPYDLRAGKPKGSNAGKK